MQNLHCRCQLMAMNGGGGGVVVVVGGDDGTGGDGGEGSKSEGVTWWRMRAARAKRLRM